MILMVFDSVNCSVLILVYLNTDLHTIDYGMLLNRLEVSAGISGLVLDLFSSDFSDRTFSV